MILGLGIDVVEIERVRALLERKGERAMRRLFTEREATYASGKAHPAIHLAARLAAKEAAFKALSGNDLARGVGWREIEVMSGKHGPELVFHGLAEERAIEMRVRRVHVSLTHTHMTAAAVVMLEG